MSNTDPTKNPKIHTYHTIRTDLAGTS